MIEARRKENVCKPNYKGGSRMFNEEKENEHIEVPKDYSFDCLYRGLKMRFKEAHIITLL